MTPQPMPAGELSKEWFRRYYTIDPDNGCWLCTASKMRTGYCQISVRGKIISAHRLSWKVHNGPIPEGKWVLHKCDIRCCINPEHLYIGTRADNARDMMERGRHFAQTHPEEHRAIRRVAGVIGGRCNNWSAGEGNGRAILSADQVREIRASSESKHALAGRYGVKANTIYKVQHGKIWKSV